MPASDQRRPQPMRQARWGRNCRPRAAGNSAHAPVEPGADDLHAQALARLAQHFDAQHGGFGEAPKFPQAALLQYLLLLAATGRTQAREMLLAALQAMAAGGIYDQVGGGFSRYSTDARWHGRTSRRCWSTMPSWCAPTSAHTA